MGSAPASLGAYQIVAKLARGGMASVYVGRRSGPADFSRYVAIKLVHEEHSNDEALIAMLLDEARLSVNVQHPNVVRVEELGEAEEGQPYLVMEFVDGVDLSTVLSGLVRRKEPLSIDAAVHIVAEAAAGLHAAHEATDQNGQPFSIVHRDVSPQNIMVSRQGLVKVIDFGIAKAKGRLTATAHGSLKGKLAYMSPEQLRGATIDRRTDLFALAIVLWEMLSLRRLFYSRNTAETMKRISTGQVGSPRQYRPAISDALEGVVLKALSKNPEDRYQTAREMRRALLMAHPAVIDAAALKELVRQAARDKVKTLRPPIPAALLERTSVSVLARPIPTSHEELRARLRESLAGNRADDAKVAAEELMLAGDEEGIARALADRQDATSMRIRADLAKGRHDLSQELVTREALCALPEAKAADEYALSLVLIKLGDFRHAVRILERMVTPDPETSVDKHLALGDALSGWARIDEARDSYGDAATLALERGDGVQVMTAALGLARLSFASGRRCFARAEAERVRDEAKSMNQDKLLIEAWTEISRAAFGTGDTREGIRAAYEAQAAALRANTSPLRPRLASVLSLAIELDGDVAQGKQLREDAREALRSKALQISDTEWRRCFLEHVPAHAELMMD